MEVILIDHLYKRKRIDLEKIRKLKSIKILLLILFASCMISLFTFLKGAYPVFKSSCETAASSKGVKIINDEVNKVMKDFTYDSIINIEKDVEGNISLIKADTVKINEITSRIISNIQKEFDKIPRITVFINMGTVSGISALNNVKPKFEIELESAGTLDSDVKTEFKSVGINQTQHKIYLDLKGKIGILTPISTFSKNINMRVLLMEAVIVGDVPDTYYNLEGMTEQSETFNFIE